MINELGLVVLKRDLPKERLAAGDVGTVVLVHQQGAGLQAWEQDQGPGGA
jgi:hypothetical protein